MNLKWVLKGSETTSRGEAMTRVFDTIRFAVYFSSRSFTDQAANALPAARKHAVAPGLHDITPEHVLFGVAGRAAGVRRTRPCRVSTRLLWREGMAAAALADSQPAGKSYDPLRLAPETERFLSRAKVEARELGVKYVAAEQLALGLLSEIGSAADFLRERGVTRDRFLAELQKFSYGIDGQ